MDTLVYHWLQDLHNLKCEQTGQSLNRKVIGYDINTKRVEELKKGIDFTNELKKDEFNLGENLSFTCDISDIINADFYIVTVPTPVDRAKQPDLRPLVDSSIDIAKILKKRTHISSTSPIIIYESTVYPGAIEEVCVPAIEDNSGLHYNQDFYCGYSPERINPGDKKNRLESIVKVTSGSNDTVASIVDSLYASIVTAGTFKAANIKVAEASKVIENVQRDVNIALINEFAVIFDRIGINTVDVLSAAKTKWNFLSFSPGLVGGHCIGVDPYYLTHKSEVMGYYPQIIPASRRINENV